MTGSRVSRGGADGVVLLDKPAGITSHTAVQRVRRLYGGAKGGHTGTLDPLATGLLPVCLGEATKFSHVLLESPKTYLATIRLGMTTDTGDLEGAVLSRVQVAADGPAIRHALDSFVGDIEQVPPMYSAIKRAGQPLYKLARAGREVERSPRRVRVERIELVEVRGEELTIRVRCSKGTYIRVLAEDVGRTLGCGGCLSALRREAVGEFHLSDAPITLERIESLPPEERLGLLLPADALLAALPRFDLDPAATRRVSHGQPIEHASAQAAGLARIYGPGSRFLGLAEVTVPGRIVPRRLTTWD